MDRSDHKDDPARAGACTTAGAAPRCPALAGTPLPAPAWPRRLLSAAMTAAALLVGFNAFVQALNVLAAWWRGVG